MLAQVQVAELLRDEVLEDAAARDEEEVRVRCAVSALKVADRRVLRETLRQPRVAVEIDSRGHAEPLVRDLVRQDELGQPMKHRGQEDVAVREEPCREEGDAVGGERIAVGIRVFHDAQSVPRIRTVADDVVGEDVARVGGEQSRLVDVAFDVGHFDRRRAIEDVAFESRGEGEGERSSGSAVADRVGGDSVVRVFGRRNGEFDIVRSRRQHDVGGHRNAGFDLRAGEYERERVRGPGVENSVLLAERASGLQEEGKPPETPGERVRRHSAVAGCDPRSARGEANLDRGGGLDVVHGEHRVGEAVRLQSGRHRE